MILFNGKVFVDDELPTVLDGLWDQCIEAIAKRKTVDEMAKLVMDACATLAERIRAGNYDEILLPLLKRGIFSRAQLEEAVAFFQRENMAVKYETELGVLLRNLKNTSKIVDRTGDEQTEQIEITRSIEPLGILFHIAAGNAEGLPFFSVIEGMLAGNVNILKLPSADDGISIMLLHELVQICPYLASYVCVVDVPSTDMAVMKRLAEMADAVVVWGGDEAVKAVRSMADAKTQVISWGHKLSFAYVTTEATDEELKQLAEHICITRQVLCNSCQGIFVDTEDAQIVTDMGMRFLKILEEVNGSFPKESVGVRGKVSISLYNEELESRNSGRKVLRGDGVSVIVSMDDELELSYMFKNCWVKPLPRKDIIKALKDKKGYLQTVGLLCAEREREELAGLFIKTGITHVTRAGRMAHTTPGMAHDGEYPLRRYTKVAEAE